MHNTISFQVVIITYLSYFIFLENITLIGTCLRGAYIKTDDNCKVFRDNEDVTMVIMFLKSYTRVITCAYSQNT